MSNTICLSCGAEFDRDLLLTDEELGNGYCPACMSDYIEFGYTESHDEEIPLIVVERQPGKGQAGIFIPAYFVALIDKKKIVNNPVPLTFYDSPSTDKTSSISGS